MTDTAKRAALRQVTLAVCVLDEIDLSPDDDGVILLDGSPLSVSWDEVSTAIGDAEPLHEKARRRVCEWFRLRRMLASVDDPSAALRPLGLPVGSSVHPGRAWVHHRVLGDAIDVGVGALLPGPGSEAAAHDGVEHTVVGLHPACLAAAGMAASVDWHELVGQAERMGTLAAHRLKREPLILKPMGDCDVVTLLTSATLRETLAARDSSGMCAAVVPMRRRGWLDPSRTDPAFALAAAAATQDDARGFDRPILITADEVSMAVAGGRPVEIVLRDPVVAGPTLRDLRWR